MSLATTRPAQAAGAGLRLPARRQHLDRRAVPAAATTWIVWFTTCACAVRTKPDAERQRAHDGEEDVLSISSILDEVGPDLVVWREVLQI